MTRVRLVVLTREFASAVVEVVERLPRGRAADVIGIQLLRSATSVGANYRAACRARSRKEFIAKMGIVEEEADESDFWLGLLLERGLVDARLASSLRQRAGQILAMTVSSIRTARGTPRATPHSAFRIPHSGSPHSAPRTPHLSASISDVH